MKAHIKFLLFFIKKTVLIIFVLFFDEASNFCNRILANNKQALLSVELYVTSFLKKVALNCGSTHSLPTLPLICSLPPSISTCLAYLFPFPLMFSPLLLNLRPFSVHIITGHINCIFSFWNYGNASSRQLEC